MATAEEFWNLIEPVVKDQGLELFDLDVPGINARVLRVYIWHGYQSKEAVTVGNCANVSKALSRMTEFESLMPESSTLEVASPGINRRLRRPEHFEGALGERLKLTVTGLDPSNPTKKDTVTGLLKSIDNEVISFEIDNQLEIVDFPLNDIHKARIDFDFIKEK
ncbi:MAG: hypothetical protein KDD56_08610 [Bdellovibrionales bacterium]|nr:hypothetical protein [Bdellovibrionales bacterium]